MRRGRKQSGDPVQAVAAGADLAVAVSAIATGTAAAQPEGTRGSAGNLAGSHKDLDRPGGYPAGQQCWGGFYGWSIKHNV